MIQQFQCPLCGYVNTMGNPACISCGEFFNYYCPYCNFIVNRGNTLCPNCNFGLTWGSTADSEAAISNTISYKQTFTPPSAYSQPFKAFSRTGPVERSWRPTVVLLILAASCLILAGTIVVIDRILNIR